MRPSYPLLSVQNCTVSEYVWCPAVSAMESDKTTQITAEVIRLMDLQVEVLKGTLAEMTVSQVHEYAERRDRIGQLCLELG